MPLFAQGFRMFSPLHGVALLTCAVAILLIIRLGRSAKRRGEERRVTLIIAWVGIGFWLLQQVHALTLANDPASSVPLHICDLTAILGPVALLTRIRLLRTTVYFWALGLSVWGLLTPTLNGGPTTPDFWLFWISHGLVMLYGFYECFVLGYRPFAQDFGLVLLVTLGYVAIVLPINLANPGWNYGYLADVPVSVRTPLDFLPRWPWRILAIEALGGFMMGYGWLPWEVVRWRRRRKEAGAKVGSSI